MQTALPLTPDMPPVALWVGILSAPMIFLRSILLSRTLSGASSQMQPRCSNSFVALRTGCGLFWNFKSLFPGEVQVTYFYVYRVSYNYTQLHNCHLHIIHTCKYRFDTQSGWFKPVFCLLLARLLTALTPSILAESFSLLIPFCVLPSKNEGASGMSGIHTSRCCTVVSLRQFESGNLDFQCVCFMWGTQPDVTRLCFGCFFFPLLTVQAEFLERYGRLMPKEQWPQLVGPRHFGWFEGRCMKLISGCKMTIQRTV